MNMTYLNIHAHHTLHTHLTHNSVAVSFTDYTVRKCTLGHAGLDMCILV